MSVIRSFRNSASNSPPPPTSRRHLRASNSPPGEGTEEVFQTIVQNRKSWKTARGGETVWPPELEAALLEGLASYQPDDSRETRLLGRFPMRNRIISDYIYEKTGKRRTAKQVGSRLQQLRDTCGGSQLLKLLSPVPRPSHSASEDESTPSPSAPPRTHIPIEILPDGIPCPCASPSCRFSHTVDGMQSLDDISHGPDSPKGFGHLGAHPRPLRSIDPTITFTAHSEVDASSAFTVFHGTTAVYSETIPLTLGSSVSTEESENLVLCSTPLVPGYWQTICSSSDPSRYSISQEVQDIYTSSVIFSALYTFVFPPGITWRGTSMHVLNNLSIPSPSLSDRSLSLSPRNSKHTTSNVSPTSATTSFPSPLTFAGGRGSSGGHFIEVDMPRPSSGVPPQFEIDAFGNVFDSSPLQANFAPDIHMLPIQEHVHYGRHAGSFRHQNKHGHSSFHEYDSAPSSDTDSVNSLSPMTAYFGQQQALSTGGSSGSSRGSSSSSFLM